MANRCLYMILLWLIPFSGMSQILSEDYKPDPKFAKLCLRYNNYVDGLKEYKLLLADDPENIDYKHGAAICYLNLNQDKKQAVEILEWIVKQKKYDVKAHYDLGHAYLQTYQLDAAIQQFNLYLKEVKEDENRIPATKMIEMCKNAQKAMENPIHVSIENLGEKVNSKYPDFNPFVPSNESILLFNSQRKSNMGSYAFYDGYYPSDIYMATFKFGKWRRLTRLPSSINSSNIEKIVGLTSDGLNLFLIQEDIEGNKQTFYTQKRGRYYRNLQPIFIQDVRYEKIHSLTISPNRKYLVFSADRKDGIGGKDLYMSFRLPNGYWSSAQLLDSVVNTIYDEDFPYFSPDGEHFFFASEGHNSMGGYDIFKARWNPKDSIHITQIDNVGYPVNTTLDDQTISFSKSGRYAYMSSYREDSYGDLDIYRVVFKDAEPTYSVVYGKVFDQDSTLFTDVIKKKNDHIDTLNFPVNWEYKRLLLEKKDSVAAYKVLAKKIPHEKVDVQVKAVNMETGELFGNFIAKNRTAKYAVILPPGKWKLIFSRKGYQETVVENIEIEERDRRNKMIERNVSIKAL